MLMLFVYVFVALGFSFFCSIAEAVLLSVTTPYIALLEQKGNPAGALLRRHCANINQPLAAILTLNTIAHTVGAAGAGAQVAVIFGSAYLGVASAILTLLILVLSEIIPKSLGAHHWRALAPLTAYGLKYLIWALYPLVKLADGLTRRLGHGEGLTGVSRDEFSALVDIGAEDGELEQWEKRILKNLLLLSETTAKNCMTPRTVMFCLAQNTTVDAYIKTYSNKRFSRIPIYHGDPENISGFVLRSDLLLARGEGQGQTHLRDYRRNLPAMLSAMSVIHALNELQRQHSHIMLIVDEYGGVEGLLSLEDVLETLLGLEIMDESDSTADMQKLALRLWQRRALKDNLSVDTQAEVDPVKPDD